MSNILSEEGLSFDDVLLVPDYSAILPDEVGTRTRLTKGLELNIPIVSAAMDTVTEARTAISMARAGGLGFIHRNLSIEEQSIEVDRVKKALEIAESGKKVSLVSGGDPGIYAMAGLAFDVAKKLNFQTKIEIIAGIAALNSCAERLGAPLMHDFATISLSDLLTPWEVIEKRLEAAASADFVMVIYNPKSKKRNWQLDSAIAIIRRYRQSALCGHGCDCSARYL